MILVARPAPHLSRTLEALRIMGYGPESLLSFSLAEPETLPLTLPPQATALILTSPLACPSLASVVTHLPVYAVGPTTAAAARALGLTVVFTGSDNGHTMAADMVKQLTQPQHFAHLHGDHAGMEWHTLLQKGGHQVTPVTAYRTGHIETLAQATLQNLTHQAFPATTLLFSAGSARHLANLLKQANITPGGTALCLSDAVAAEARLHWPLTRTASHPTLEGVLALLKQA